MDDTLKPPSTQVGVNAENPNKPKWQGRWGGEILTPTYRMSSLTVDAQNKKYLCAIGNSFAGSQVSSTPSALTS